MSDLTGVPGSAAIGRNGDGGTRLPTGATTDPSAPISRIRTPRDVMNERQAREARRRAEAGAGAEADVRADQQRRIDLERRRSAERRAAAAAQQTNRGPGYRSAASAGGRTPAAPTYANPGASPMVPAGASSQIPQGSSFAESSASGLRTGGIAPRPTQGTSTAQPSSYAQQQQPQAQAGSAPVPPSQAPRGSNVPQPGTQSAQPGVDNGQSRSNMSSFPHAFERWETLSSHWEGLTSYWIRKLEMNTEAIRRENDISREQMSRQITDLSAAGANLFHAVVELQRLRASSERKFQRWFFDTRAKQERDDEERQRLQNDLDSERQEKANMPTQALRVELDLRFAEMRRELQISKEEARRAWEELGRREQEERDRQLALREGHPIFVGGVQVLPMSAVSRGGSVQQRPATRDPGYAAPAATSGQEFELQQEPSPTNTDPFTSRDPQAAEQPSARTMPGGQGYPSSSQPMSGAESSAQAAQAPTVSGFYRRPETYVQDPIVHAPAPPGSAFSEGSEEDPPAPEIDEQGNIRYDTQGRPIPFRPSAAMSGGGGTSSSAVTYPTIPAATTVRAVPQQASSEPETSDDEYDAQVQEREQTAIYLQQGLPGPRGTQRAQQNPADYEEDGFGEGTGWESIPRHQHPTRLSDVLEEEDERSRASPSSGAGPSRR